MKNKFAVGSGALSVLMLSLLSPSVMADYRNQADVQLTMSEGDDTFNDYLGAGSAYTFYFEKIDTSSGPLAEAAFLSKSGFARVGATYNVFDTGTVFGSVDDVSGLTAETQWVFADKVIVALDAEQEKITYVGGEALRHKLWGGKVGLYVGRHSAVTLNIQKSQATSYGSFDALLTEYSVEYKGVFSVGAEQFFSLRFVPVFGEFEFGDQSFGVTTEFNWYFNRAFSVGILAAGTVGEDADQALVGSSVRYFFSDMISISAQMTGGTEFFANGDTASAGAATCHLSMRF